MTSTLPGQAAPDWSSVSIPSGVATANAVSIGKLVSYVDGNTLHVYSAALRRWATRSVASNALVRLMNDCLIVQDIGGWTAFSAYRGTFEALSTSPASQLLNPGGNNNDTILLVADGSQLHAFSGFQGAWTTRTLAPGYAWSVQRHTAVVNQGNLLTAMDAFTGQWHDLMVPVPPTTVTANGTAGFAFGPATAYGFSAVHGTWQTAPGIPNATFVRADDWAMLYDSTQMLAYSGLRGNFDQAPLGVTTMLATEDLFALFDTPAGVFAFSAIRGAFSAPLSPTPLRVRSNGAVSVIVEGNFVHAYSAVRNDSATIVLPSIDEGASNIVAYALDAVTSQAHLYSASTGQWYQSPPDALPGAPVVTTTTALLATATGAHGFSARTGNFVPLVAPNLVLSGNNTSAPNLAWNTTDIFTFDPRRDWWTGVARATNGPLVIQGWRTALIAIDGLTAFGFGSQDGRWSQYTLPGPTTSLRTNSESGRITTANHVIGYSALPELQTLAQFPHFRRVQTIAAPMRLKLPLQVGDFAVMGVNQLLPVPLPVPGLGLLQLDIAGLATSNVLATPNGVAVDLVYQLPASSVLQGTQWAFQAVVLPATGTPYFTGACTIAIL
ncbi:MAG: hypothetical protein ABIP94_01725 [Planctomycetota bacterium]